MISHHIKRQTLGLVALLAASAAHGDNTPPTVVEVRNATNKSVYANLVLGQPPTSNPSGCQTYPTQIASVTDGRLVFTSSKGDKPIKFVQQTTGVTTKGYYLMAPKETITYKPVTFACQNQTGLCSPAVTFNFFFTNFKYNGNPNNGCGASTKFPNATNLGEASINFGISDYKNVPGAQSALCPNADATDISVVNGANSIIDIKLTGLQWPSHSATNGELGTNANRVGVFGWAATNCTNDAGYPNPASNCAAPNNAPTTVGSNCFTPNLQPYAPISFNGKSYCPEISDTDNNYCNIQGTGNYTGGVLKITFDGFLLNTL